METQKIFYKRRKSPTWREKNTAASALQSSVESHSEFHADCAIFSALKFTNISKQESQFWMWPEMWENRKHRSCAIAAGTNGVIQMITSLGFSPRPTCGCINTDPCDWSLVLKRVLRSAYLSLRIYVSTVCGSSKRETCLQIATQFCRMSRYEINFACLFAKINCSPK